MKNSISPPDLAGVIDLHIHCAPDVMPRSMDGLEVAALAGGMGMRAIVLKNHFEHTASLASLARKHTPAVETFGSIALNRPVGGINPAAVEHMTGILGGFGRIVWMPTFEAENHVRRAGSGRPFVSVARDGRLLPEVFEVLELVAKHNLVFATGHSSPGEALLLIREARKLGIQKVIATHAIADPVFMNTAETMEAAALGAFVEFTCLELSGPKLATSAKQHAEAIRKIGVERCILSSDLGQSVNPPAPRGLLSFIGQLAREGFSELDLHLMTKRNPARIIGLE